MDDILKVEKLSQDSVLRVPPPFKGSYSLYVAAADEHCCKGKPHPDTDRSSCNRLGCNCIQHSCQGSAWADTLDREGWATTHKVPK